MQHRIRVAGILYHAGQILLVEQHSPKSGLSRWSPPAGGLELTDPDIYAGVEREVREETGLEVRAGELRFVSEFHHTHSGTLMLELWIDCYPVDGAAFGTPHLENTRHDDYISDVRWWTQVELGQIRTNRPLKAPVFWEELGAPVSVVRHLGRWEE